MNTAWSLAASNKQQLAWRPAPPHNESLQQLLPSIRQVRRLRLERRVGGMVAVGPRLPPAAAAVHRLPYSLYVQAPVSARPHL